MKPGQRQKITIKKTMALVKKIKNEYNYCIVAIIKMLNKTSAGKMRRRQASVSMAG